MLRIPPSVQPGLSAASASAAAASVPYQIVVTSATSSSPVASAGLPPLCLAATLAATSADYADKKEDQGAALLRADSTVASSRAATVAATGSIAPPPLDVLHYDQYLHNSINGILKGIGASSSVDAAYFMQLAPTDTPIRYSSDSVDVLFAPVMPDYILEESRQAYARAYAKHGVDAASAAARAVYKAAFNAYYDHVSEAYTYYHQQTKDVADPMKRVAIARAANAQQAARATAKKAAELIADKHGYAKAISEASVHHAVAKLAVKVAALYTCTPAPSATVTKPAVSAAVVPAVVAEEGPR